MIEIKLIREQTEDSTITELTVINTDPIPLENIKICFPNAIGLKYLGTNGLFKVYEKQYLKHNNF